MLTLPSLYEGSLPIAIARVAIGLLSYRYGNTCRAAMTCRGDRQITDNMHFERQIPILPGMVEYRDWASC